MKTKTAGTLTVGTDKPAYEPWFVDDDPSNGKGFESAVAYAVADKLGFANAEVTWVVAPASTAVDRARREDVRHRHQPVLDHRRAQEGHRLLLRLLRRRARPSSRSRAARPPARRPSPTSRTPSSAPRSARPRYKAIEDAIEPSQQAAVFDTNDDAKLALANGQIDGIVVDLPTAFYIDRGTELDDGVIVGQLPDTRQHHRAVRRSCSTRAAR